MTDILVNSDELIAEALTFYASELRQQSEFCAYMMDDNGQKDRLEKVHVIEQLLIAHDRMDTNKTQSIEPAATDAEPVVEGVKHPVGFTSQKIQASPKNPKPIVGLPKTPWDVV